jgi:hypothetical protein
LRQQKLGPVGPKTGLQAIQANVIPSPVRILGAARNSAPSSAFYVRSLIFPLPAVKSGSLAPLGMTITLKFLPRWGRAVFDPYKSKGGQGSEQLLLQFFLKQVVLVFGRLSPLVCDDAGHRGSQAGLSRAAAGFHALVQFLFAFSLHPKLTQPKITIRTKSSVEDPAGDWTWNRCTACP